MLQIQEQDGEFECFVQGATGSPTCGRGLTVAEAIGDWIVHSGQQNVVCDEQYWDRYKAEEIRGFRPIRRRS